MTTAEQLLEAIKMLNANVQKLNDTMLKPRPTKKTRNGRLSGSANHTLVRNHTFVRIEKSPTTNKQIDIEELTSLPFNPELAKKRRQLLANGYGPHPAAGKAIRVPEWSKGDITEARLAEIEAAHPDHTNTGLRTGRLVGVDIDLSNAAHVIEIELVVANALTESLLRRVGAKGALLCYRNDAPIPKITIGAKDKRLVEILGAGQHFVAYGVHPVSGKEYEWTQDWLGGDPLQTPLADLPHVTPEQLYQVAAHAIAAKLSKLGYGDVAVTGIKAEREHQSAARSIGSARFSGTN